MLPLETKQSGGKLLPNSDLRGGVFLEEVSGSRKRKRDILLGTWNVRSLYRAGSHTAAASALARYKLDLVGCRKLRGTERAQYELETIIFTMEREMKIVSWEQVFFVHQRISSAVKRVGFVCDRMTYIVLRGRWCNIIVLNVHALSEETSEEELEQVFFYHFPKYNKKILLGEFNANVGREYLQTDNWE
jgi:hypothetical protein